MPTAGRSSGNPCRNPPTRVGESEEPPITPRFFVVRGRKEIRRARIPTVQPSALGATRFPSYRGSFDDVHEGGHGGRWRNPPPRRLRPASPEALLPPVHAVHNRQRRRRRITAASGSDRRSTSRRPSTPRTRRGMFALRVRVPPPRGLGRPRSRCKGHHRASGGIAKDNFDHVRREPPQMEDFAR